MANECSSTREVTSTFIVRGPCYLLQLLFAWSHLLRYSKGKDYTYMYGKHVGEGSLTPFLAKAFDERVDK